MSNTKERLNELLTTTKVAKLMGVSVPTVNNWINSGKLKSKKSFGGFNKIVVKSLLVSLYLKDLDFPEEYDTEQIKKYIVSISKKEKERNPEQAQFRKKKKSKVKKQNNETITNDDWDEVEGQ